MNDQPSQSLVEALERIGIEVETSTLMGIQHYCSLLWERNETLNLTRHTDFDTFASRDVLDTWQLSNLIRQDAEVLDIGSGGGVPGLLLSILRPDLRITCVDSVGKKAAVLEQFAAALEAPVEVYHNRAEELLDSFRYDYCVARAVGPLWKICQWFQPHWLNVGHLLAIKGPRYKDEIAEAKEKNLLNKVDLEIACSYPMPNTENESVILDLCLKTMRNPE